MRLNYYRFPEGTEESVLLENGCGVVLKSGDTIYPKSIPDDVRVVALFEDGTAMVWHDHTVDGVWASEKNNVYPSRRITHWMENPKLPEGIAQ